jgi:hypothetical protein
MRDDDENEFLCGVKSNHQIASVLFLALLLHPCLHSVNVADSKILNPNWEREPFGGSRLSILKSCSALQCFFVQFESPHSPICICTRAQPSFTRRHSISLEEILPTWGFFASTFLFNKKFKNNNFYC